MKDLDDIIKRYTKECVSLLAGSVQKHLKDLQEENEKLKAENVLLKARLPDTHLKGAGLGRIGGGGGGGLSTGGAGIKDATS